MTDRPPRERYRIVLVDAMGHDEVPVIHRLRKFLKMALRSYGLRCIEIRPEVEQSDAEQPEDGCALRSVIRDALQALSSEEVLTP